jgi:predicted DNA-binding protein (MmcQ/YjbR family)
VTADSLRDRVIGAYSAKPGSAEDYPFCDEVTVFRVAGKMFALVTPGPPPGSVSLRCDPNLAAGLRRRYDLIDHSYELVVARLRRAERDKLNT